jgi:hypothetical protein
MCSKFLSVESLVPLNADTQPKTVACIALDAETAEFHSNFLGAHLAQVIVSGPVRVSRE